MKQRSLLNRKIPNREFRLLPGLLAMFLLATGLCAISDAQAESEYGLLPWKELLFEGSKPLTRFFVRLRLEDARGRCPYPLSETGTEFLECPVDLPGVLLISAETVTMSLVLPQEKYEHFVWFRPKGLGVLERMRWKTSGKQWIKLYRWKDEAVLRLSIRPANEGEAEGPVREWSKRHFSSYPVKIEGRFEKAPRVTEPLVLLYLASTAAVKKQKASFDLFVFGKKALHKVKFSFKKRRHVKVRYTERLNGKERNKVEKVLTYVYEVTPEELSGRGGRHGERFSLLGLQHDIEIYVDVESGMIVRIKGKNDLVGEVDLRLKEVRERDIKRDLRRFSRSSRQASSPQGSPRQWQPREIPVLQHQACIQ